MHDDGPRKVVVIDDSRIQCAVWKRLLENRYGIKVAVETYSDPRDGVKAQENFKAKQEFPFELLSDKEEALCKLFDVIKLKKMYGRESFGIERSTFLIDPKGVLRREWRKVKVKGHVDEVLEAVEALRKELGSA